MIRIKVVIALVVVSVLFLALVYNKFEQSLFADKIENVELQLKNQVTTMATAYEADSKFILKWAQTLSIEGTRRINWSAMSPYFAVARLNTAFQVVEWSFRESSPVSAFSKETLTQLVYSYQINPENTQISYQFFVDQEKKRILLTLVPVKGQLWVFASLGENLQSLIDNQKTLSSSLALVNKDLVSIAHVKPEYVGQKIFENSVIKDLRENNKTMASGSFGISSGEEFFAVMEKVPNMELYLYTQTSLSDIIKSKSEFRRQFAFFSFGFLFILVGVLFLLIPKEKSVSSTSPGGMAVKSPVFVAPAVSVVSPPASAHELKATSGVDRMQTNMKIASALGHEMKAPLVKILSLVQLGNFTESKEEMAKVLGKMKSEVRSANEIVEKLLLFAGEKEQNRIKAKIDTPLLRALKSVEALCYQKVIKLTKELGETEPFDMDVNQLVTVFENILKNSIQALDRKSNKEIKIKTASENGNVCVFIEDNGEGIPKEISDKIFDPFFTSMNVSQHMGLGLTVALGIVKQHNGNVIVDSERGKGTRVRVEFAREHEKKTEPPAMISQTSYEDNAVVIKDKVGPDPIVASAAAVPSAMTAPIVKAPNVIDTIKDDVSEELVVETSKKAFVKSDNSDNNDNDDDASEMLQKVSARPMGIKPIDLNVDVDALFEVSEAVTVKTEVPLEPQRAVVPEPATASKGNLLNAALTKTPKSSRASDEFKVVVRKPGRPF